MKIIIQLQYSLTDSRVFHDVKKYHAVKSPPNTTQPNPTHGWTQPMTNSVLNNRYHPSTLYTIPNYPHSFYDQSPTHAGHQDHNVSLRASSAAPTRPVSAAVHRGAVRNSGEAASQRDAPYTAKHRLRHAANDECKWEVNDSHPRDGKAPAHTRAPRAPARLNRKSAVWRKHDGKPRMNVATQRSKR